jgi:hypothetical protein
MWQHGLTAKFVAMDVATGGAKAMKKNTKKNTAGKPQRKQNLTDKGLKALKPAADGKPFEVMNSSMPALGMRVMGSGVKSFILFRRFPGSDNPVRRSLGSYPAMTLAQAREKARQWLNLIEKGIDPAEEAKRLKEAAIEAERAAKAATFGAPPSRII